MNKQLIVAAVGALLLPLSFVAKADGISGGTEFTVYGRVVAGVYRNDTDKDGESATWEIGGTGIDGGRLSGSRLGFKADRDIGNGMNVGFKLEQQFEGGGGPNEQRHRYVYISGGFGNLSIGNAVGPRGDSSYDGSYFLGGNFREGTDRRDGLHYSNSVGAFNFGLSVTGNEGAEGATALDDDTADARTADEDIDRTIIGAGYDFGAFAVNVAHDADNTDNDENITELLVSGDYGPLHYKLGYQARDDATKNGKNDRTAAGLFLAYSATENDKFYLEYESGDDDDTPMMAGTDTDEGGTATLLGYERKIGGGAVFVAEYRSISNDASDGAPADADNSPSRLNLAMIVNF